DDPGVLQNLQFSRKDERPRAAEQPEHGHGCVEAESGGDGGPEKKADQGKREAAVYSSFSASIFFACSARKSSSFFDSSGRLPARIATAKSPALTAPGFPIAKVATGIPPGICAVDSSESSPFSEALSIGTPSTGSVVCAAATPAR